MTIGQEVAQIISGLKYFTQETIARLIDNKIKEHKENGTL